MSERLAKVPEGEKVDEEEPLGYLYTHYDCPGCGEPGEIEGDAGGDLVKCDVCGTIVRIREIR